MKSTICHISDEPLEGDKVRDHCHITGQLENKNPPCHRGPYPQPPSTPPSQPHSGVCPVLHLPRQRGELPAGPRSNHQGAVSESGHELQALRKIFLWECPKKDKVDWEITACTFQVISHHEGLTRAVKGGHWLENTSNEIRCVRSVLPFVTIQNSDQGAAVQKVKSIQRLQKSGSWKQLGMQPSRVMGLFRGLFRRSPKKERLIKGW